MFARRLFPRWQFVAAVVLPAWLTIGWAVFGGGGWGTLGLVITLPATFLSVLVVALLVNARPTVREQRAVAWGDVGVIGAWHLAIIATGFYGATAAAFGVLSIALAVVAFWWAIWQLVRDGSRRMQASMAEFERLAAQQQGAQAPRTPPFDAGEVIVVREARDPE
ncbi:hypothetical protein GE115_02210 [Agromyces sp. CFH 90414]|uniref:MFS transporter n=1 Tax=Agromyces agglutinans TaxID=2662258 RepID=A0A6I2F7E5_9MICO|nr:hypothetical protein [Agromyces agglutinans]MRG58690.1 hypothetical protein [Agromyces agglutinans]